jgi:hypothetical protein
LLFSFWISGPSTEVDDDEEKEKKEDAATAKEEHMDLFFISSLKTSLKTMTVNPKQI